MARVRIGDYERPADRAQRILILTDSVRRDLEVEVKRARDDALKLFRQTERRLQPSTIRERPSDVELMFSREARERAGVSEEEAQAQAVGLSPQELASALERRRRAAEAPRAVPIGETLGPQLLETLDVPRREVGLPVAREALKVPAALAEVGQTLAPSRLPGVPGVRGLTEPLFTPQELRSETAAEALSFVTDPLNLALAPGTVARGARAGARGLRTGARAVARGAEARGGARGLARELAVGEAGGTRLPGEGAEEAAEAAAKVPTPGVEPDPVEKLTGLIKQARKPRVETELLKHEELQRRFGRVGRILEAGKGTPEQRLIRAKGQLKGELPKAEFEAVRPAMEDAEVQELIDRALTFDFGLGRQAEKIRTADSLTRLLMGELPTTGELGLLERVFGPEFVKAVKTKRPLGQRAWENFVDVLNLPRTVLATLDHSFPGRQGIKLAPSHPKEWFGSAVAGAKAMGRERVAAQLDEFMRTDGTPVLVRFAGGRVESMPFSQVKEMAGLYHAPFGEAATLAEREEVFVSRWGAKFWPVKMSQRGYITSANKIRHDTLKRLTMTANLDGQPVDFETIQGWSNLLNRATGRGTLKFGPANAEQLAPVLSAVQFAPRFRLSGPQWAAHILHSNPAVRKEAANQFVKFFSTGASLLAAIKLSGLADVETDCRSSDFGKIRLGKMRIDFWGGLQQQARAICQIATGERKALESGRISPVSGEDVAFDYFRSGMSPWLSDAVDIYKGETQVGEPVDLSRESLERQLWEHIPIGWQDIKDAVQLEGLTGAFLSPLALLGVGVQTFEPSASSELAAIPEFRGDITVEQIGELQDFYNEVERARDFWRLNYGEEVGVEDAIREMAKRKGWGPNRVEWAILLRPGSKTRGELRNPEWIDFIVENEEELREQRPWLFERNYIIDAIREARKREPALTR